MDLIKTQLIESVIAGGGEMGARSARARLVFNGFGPIGAMAAIASLYNDWRPDHDALEDIGSMPPLAWNTEHGFTCLESMLIASALEIQ